MKIFAVRDETAEFQKDLAYLIYYERERKFYIELPERADPWETPLILSSFAEKGITTVDSYWSRLWVQQRIVPTDRQNIGQILKDNQLKEYDEYSLLMLAKGRCAQDDYYLVPMTENQLPEEIQARFSRRVEDVLPLDDYTLLTFFRNGRVKKCVLGAYFQRIREYQILLKRKELFDTVKVQTGGHGVTWDISMNVPDFQLYEEGIEIPLSASDFRAFAASRVVNVAEAAEILNCSRQNIDYLTRTGKLHPIKETGKNTMYLKSEVLKQNWQ